MRPIPYNANMRSQKPMEKSYTPHIVASIFAVIVIAGGFAAGCPVYNVWSATKAGQAELAQATANRQIKVQEAEALAASAEFQAKAEVIRAQGVAKANEIIGKSLEGNESYLRYLWIQSLADKTGDKEVIYVPTEANLPLLEASRLNHTPRAAAPAPAAPPWTGTQSDPGQQSQRLDAHHRDRPDRHGGGGGRGLARSGRRWRGRGRHGRCDVLLLSHLGVTRERLRSSL